MEWSVQINIVLNFVLLLSPLRISYWARRGLETMVFNYNHFISRSIYLQQIINHNNKKNKV